MNDFLENDILFFEKIYPEPVLINSWLEIDTEVLGENLSFLKSVIFTKTKILAVVKADAYGHGAVRVAQKAQEKGVDYLGVATISEAEILREAGIFLPILVLGSVFPEQISVALKNNIEITLASEKNILDTEKIAKSMNLIAKVHLKIDSGMGRVGARPEKLTDLINILKKSDNLKLKGVFTHFAESENHDSTFTKLQIKIFEDSIDLLNKSGFNNFIIHAANSSAILFHPDSYFDMVRVGLAMYGITDPERDELKPVLTLKSRIINIKSIPPGHSLGYGRSFFTERQSIIGILPIGYADGLPRILSNRQDVLVKGRRCRIVGNISMDQCLVDLTEINNAEPGMEVVLIGKSGNEKITVREWSEKSFRIPYEVVCGFGNRLPRIYK